MFALDAALNTRLDAFANALSAKRICAMLGMDTAEVSEDSLARRLAQVVLAARRGAAFHYHATPAGLRRARSAPLDRDLPILVDVVIDALQRRVAWPTITDRRTGEDALRGQLDAVVEVLQTRRGVLCAHSITLHGVEAWLCTMPTEAARVDHLARLLLKEVVVLLVLRGVPLPHSTEPAVRGVGPLRQLWNKLHHR